MTRSAAERTSSRAIPQSPTNQPPDVALRGQQLALIDLSGEAGQDGLDLPEQIASLEHELRVLLAVDSGSCPCQREPEGAEPRARRRAHPPGTLADRRPARDRLRLTDPR